VDGANEARRFLQTHGKASDWDVHRLQLAWDAIALHTTVSISVFKEPEVAVCSVGIMCDFTEPERSPGGVLTREVWEGVVKEYPRTEFKAGIKETMCGLCVSKPETTYDNFVGDFGEAWVQGYSRVGKRGMDMILATDD
jgi:hypothetical protein